MISIAEQEMIAYPCRKCSRITQIVSEIAHMTDLRSVLPFSFLKRKYEMFATV